MSSNLRHICFLAVLLSVGTLPSRLVAAPPDAAGMRFFEQKIRPVLVEKCYQCHSTQANPLQAGLYVDSKEGLRTGGDSGEAIVPGKPDESLLLETLHYKPSGYQMPPEGKLPDTVIADFRKWIEMGAPDPRTDDSLKVVKRTFDIDSRRDFWSFQPPQAHPRPQVQHTAWPRNKIDYFILAKMEAAGLTPAQEAHRRLLIRRVYFDLIGFPPTYEEVEQFVADDDPQAYEKLVDRLLASPHYGERWARHWLDVVRYAEDNVNMGPHNGPYPHAYRYRDWIIEALNADMPYDEFVRRQLATDLLPETSPEDLAALGLLGLSPQYHKELLLAKEALEGQYADEWEDRVDVVGRGLLGLTVACARCHDHKFDPISAKDYYALAGVFASIAQKERTLIPEEAISASQAVRDKAASLEKQMNADIAKLAKLRKDEPRSEAIGQLEEEIAQTSLQLAQLRTSPNFKVPVANAVTEEQVRIEEKSETHQQIVYYPNQPRDLPVFIRGNINTPGEIVPRRFLEVLSPGEPKQFKNGSGRLELADSIVSPDNPLTARVFVNRIWKHHFGEGLVDTPSNFGETGSRPSHPKLLDDLASRFMRNGWSIKSLHREILTSATYRQTSHNVASDKAKQVDPANRLLSYFSRQRLDAEAYRDTLLWAAGNLDLRMGGPSGNIDTPQFNRRAIYATISRQNPSKFLQVFDFPDPTIHAESRTETTTALQQLFVLNSPFAQQQAASLALRVSATNVEEKIREVHRLLFGRNPTPSELKLGKDYLNQAHVPSSPETSESPPAFQGDRLRAEIPEVEITYSAELWIRNDLSLDERPIAGYFLSRGKASPKPTGGDHLGIMGNHAAGKAGQLIYFNGDTIRTSIVGKTKLQPQHWYHVVLIREGSEVRLYLNGNPEPELIGSAAIDYDPTDSQWFVAGRNDNFANFHGSIGSVSIYDRALDVAELVQHYQDSQSSLTKVDFEGHAQSVQQSRPVAHWSLFREEKRFPKTIDDQSQHHNSAVYEGKQTAGYGEVTPWVLYCHALLCSNELMYVD